MPDPTLRQLLSLQSGVVSRRQVIAADGTPSDIRRMLRRREWARVHEGVYVDHTGPLTWLQRAWAGVLYAAPAALCHDSAIRAVDGPGRRDHDDHGPVHVAVARSRQFVAPPGVVAHHLADLDAKVLWNASPPRVRIEQAVVDIAAEARGDFEAVSVLARAVSSRRTTAARVLEALEGRTRVARRDFLTAALRDIAEGACSVLEHAYLSRVERAHGLPCGRRQVRPDGIPIYRDVEYAAQALVVELDGRLDHTDPEARDGDLDRDLAAAVDGRVTVRLGWGQVVGRPCATASRVAALLRVRGWGGSAHACPACADSWPQLGAAG